MDKHEWFVKPGSKVEQLEARLKECEEEGFEVFALVPMDGSVVVVGQKKARVTKPLAFR